MICKRVHQIWLEGPVPDKFENNTNSLKSTHCDWEYKLWREADILKLIEDHYPEHVELYNMYPYMIQKCDVARYFILHRYGGLYADLDIFFSENIDHALGNTCTLFSANPRDTEEWDICPKLVITNSIYYAPKDNKFMRGCISNLKANRDVYMDHENFGVHVFYSTSPGFMTKMYQRYQDICNIKLNPHTYFESLDKSDRRDFKYGQELPVGSLGMHMSVGDWYP